MNFICKNALIVPAIPQIFLKSSVHANIFLLAMFKHPEMVQIERGGGRKGLTKWPMPSSEKRIHECFMSCHSESNNSLYILLFCIATTYHQRNGQKKNYYLILTFLCLFSFKCPTACFEFHAGVRNRKKGIKILV